MPKLVDHEKQQQQLALKAADYFSQEGYAGGSMRKIAAHIGVSKSALYHYFPSKEALFLAATQEVMAQIGAYRPQHDQDEAAQISTLIADLEASFGAEMSLLFDYLRGMTPAEVREDPAMQLATDTYRRIVAQIVGEDRAEAVLAQILGELLLAHLTGRTRAAPLAPNAPD